MKHRVCVKGVLKHNFWKNKSLSICTSAQRNTNFIGHPNSKKLNYSCLILQCLERTSYRTTSYKKITLCKTGDLGKIPSIQGILHQAVLR